MSTLEEKKKLQNFKFEDFETPKEDLILDQKEIVFKFRNKNDGQIYAVSSLINLVLIKNSRTFLFQKAQFFHK